MGRSFIEDSWSWFPDGMVATDTIRPDFGFIRQRYSIAEPTVSKRKSTEPDLMTSLGSDFV